ncbi:PREDICTED: triadin-like, partial [Poecilia mexicana]|uniref:triadin-like n=1 Tax=Poecilia mexicana TaxID=48701 RepID=UPI00072E3B9E
MTEAAEARSSVTTTMVIDGKAVEAGSTTLRSSKKTLTDDLYSTFSSPLAWILVLALIITWTCVFIIMFDVADYKTIADRPPAGIRKVLKSSGRRGGLSKFGSDPVKVVNDAVDESTNIISAVFSFAANLIAPDEEEGTLYAVRKKGEFLPPRSKVIGMQVQTKLETAEEAAKEEEEEEEANEGEEEEE